MKPLHWAFLVFLYASAASASDATLHRAVPFQFENNQILLKVGIGNSKPSWFILDSGASGCIVDTAVAKHLGIKTQGQAEGSGAGRGTYRVTFANNLTYELSGINFTVPRSYVINLSGQRTLLGKDVAGILGYDFFARYLVRLDFVSTVMTVNDLQAQSDDAGTVVPITITKKTPHILIRAKVEGRDPVETSVLVDSGSGDGVDIDEFSKSPERIDVIGGVGLGQEYHVTVGRAQWAEIGPYHLIEPYGATGGVQLIGLEALRRFDVTFDYAHARLILSPNKFLSEPFVADASGIDLRWTDDLRNFVVHDVAAGSPADRAGLKPNDIVVSLDNQPSKNFTIAQVQSMFTNDGRSILMQVRRGPAFQTIVLRLKRRI